MFACCKVVSAQAKLDCDIHEFEHVEGKMPAEFIPLACVVTLSGTGAEQFARWSIEVWDVDPQGKDKMTIANEGIEALAAFIKEMGMPTTFAELGADASDEVLHAIADTAVLTKTCAKHLSRNEIFDILVECR